MSIRESFRTGLSQLTNMTMLVLVTSAFVLQRAPEASHDQDLTMVPPVAAARVSWNDSLAQRFPGCEAKLPTGVIPGSVVEVRQGFPLRVDFADAWRRTHDADRTNNGRIIAQCR